MTFEILLSYLLGPAVIGLVVWVWVLWLSHKNHQIHVAETYVRKPEIESLGKTMADIQSSIAELLRTVHEMKGRMETR